MESEVYYYDEPVIGCGSGDGTPERPRYCEAIVLPFQPLPISSGMQMPGDPIPEKTDEYQARWPPDDWRATIGCPSCGIILQYDARAVSWQRACFDESGNYFSDTTCYRIEFECARKDCRVPVRFHTVLSDRIPTEVALRATLRTDFFHGNCSAGHPLLRIPQELYRVSRVMEAIPKD